MSFEQCGGDGKLIKLTIDKQIRKNLATPGFFETLLQNNALSLLLFCHFL